APSAGGFLPARDRGERCVGRKNPGAVGDRAGRGLLDSRQEVLASGGAGAAVMIKTVINVTAPREQVFSVLSDYARYKEWVPGCERCSITSATGNTSETEIVISSMKRIE